MKKAKRGKQDDSHRVPEPVGELQKGRFKLHIKKLLSFSLAQCRDIASHTYNLKAERSTLAKGAHLWLVGSQTEVDGRGANLRLDPWHQERRVRGESQREADSSRTPPRRQSNPLRDDYPMIQRPSQHRRLSRATPE